MSPRILFIIKKSAPYGSDKPYGQYTGHGLRNSAKFIVDMLLDSGIEAKLVEVVDNNCISAEVHRYRPTIVVIEALWVVPEKFDVLRKLYPDIKWIVRIHSDLPFLAQEGIAMRWIFGYLDQRNVYVAFNKPETAHSIRSIVSQWHRHKVLLLPNFYPVSDRPHRSKDSRLVKIGCFGAVRPMKNQLAQAVAAISYADQTDKLLEFHINGRCESGGSEVLKNLRDLFANTRHRLVEHGWMTHPEFLKVLHQMDVAMAVSLSETFCIVAADAVSEGVPLVCSSEIPWASDASVVPATDVQSMVSRLLSFNCLTVAFVKWSNRRKLRKYSEVSRKIWLDTL